MTSGGPIDLGALDGRIARAHEAASRERALLATERGREDARLVDPFEGLRDVAGQSTFEALLALEPGPVERPHRDALLRWVHELLQARISWDLTIDEADAEHAPDPALTPRAARARDPSLPKTFDEARRALVDAPHAVAVEAALGRLADLSAPVAAVRRELRARRFEAARRLGLDHPWALAAEGGRSAATLEALARAVLDATEPLAEELRRELARRAGRPVDAALTIDEAFAREAGEGWPARLGARWLEDVFRAATPRPPRPPSLPRALGGASFLRAAALWGAAHRRESVSRALPFALARDPYPAEAFAFGGAFAIAVADRVFARRKLGLSARAADAHSRALARALLHAIRAAAAAVLSGLREGTDPAALEELGARVFGAPLPSTLASAWSYGGFSGASRVDAPARLLGVVRAHALWRALVERFDEDWFDNPRAGAHLGAVSAGPIRPYPDVGAQRPAEVPDDGGEVAAIGRALEGALG